MSAAPMMLSGQLVRCAMTALFAIACATTVHAASYDVVLRSGDTLPDVVLDSLRRDVLFVERNGSDTAVAVDDVAVLNQVSSGAGGAVAGVLVGAVMGVVTMVVRAGGGHGSNSGPEPYAGFAIASGVVAYFIVAGRNHYDLRRMLPEERREVLASLCSN